ncbi:hypothetical protein QBC41DRAFT_393632 [Cercophora samala]|uniref:Rhodopsin domain-containing protein n=1 Tax=Cercophora samala TaxID=330535 RepID=A0AA39ZCL5_9PEZI|nr:hypothetical protein QBC41DRAFT_393632 [Cercophora samala]
MASQIGLTEPGHTKFNLTFPLLLQPSSNITPPSSSSSSSSSTTTASSTNITPGILFGILTPHIISTLFLLSRLSSRLFLLKKWFWWEDTLILASFLFSTAVCVIYTITITTTTTTSFPAHHHDTNYTLRTYLALIFYQLSLCLTKLSILAFYLRISSSPSSGGAFSPSTRRLRLLTIVTISFTLCYGLPLLFITIFQCHPSPGLYFGQPTGPPGGVVPYCFDFKPLLIASTSLHAVTDVWLICLVIPVVVGLRVPSREKAVVGVVLSLGVFVAVAGLTRLQLSLKMGGDVHFGHVPGREEGEDLDEGVTVANTLAFFVMTVLELDVAVVCACAPGVAGVVRRFWPGVLGRRRGGGSTSDDGDTEGSLDLRSVRVVEGQRTGEEEEGGKSVTDLYFAGQEGIGVRQPPALLISQHRTPHATTLSLRSFMSSLAPPRSRGRGLEEGGEGRGLLREDFTTYDMTGRETRRTTSEVGLEGYCDQYYAGLDRGQPVGEQTPEKKRRSSVRCYSGRWGG